MAMPAACASRAERNRFSCPSSSKRPENSGCTPAMIFISVLLPAPFSPTRPWISPGRSAKSTPRSASTPPKLFVMPCSSRMGRPSGMEMSDQEVILHPLHAGGIGLGHDRTVGDDVLGNALAALLATRHGRDARNDRAAMDAAGRIAHGRIHPALAHRLDGWWHRVHTANQDVGAVVRLHDVGSRERHVVI